MFTKVIMAFQCEHATSMLAYIHVYTQPDHAALTELSIIIISMSLLL